LAIRKPDGQIIFNPPADVEISEDDYLIAMGAVPALLALDVVKRPDPHLRQSLDGGGRVFLRSQSFMASRCSRMPLRE